MKNIIIVTGAILISSVIITSYLTPGTFGAASDENTVSSPSGSSLSGEPGYIISSFSGRVALYRKRDGSVLFSTDTLVSDLPDADRDALRKGIDAADMKEADRIIRELSS